MALLDDLSDGLASDISGAGDLSVFGTAHSDTHDQSVAVIAERGERGGVGQFPRCLVEQFGVSPQCMGMGYMYPRILGTIHLAVTASRNRRFLEKNPSLAHQTLRAIWSCTTSLVVHRGPPGAIGIGLLRERCARSVRSALFRMATSGAKIRVAHSGRRRTVAVGRGGRLSPPPRTESRGNVSFGSQPLLQGRCAPEEDLDTSGLGDGGDDGLEPLLVGRSAVDQLPNALVVHLETRSPLTVCREVNVNDGRNKYRALVGDRSEVAM